VVVVHAIAARHSVAPLSADPSLHAVEWVRGRSLHHTQLLFDENGQSNVSTLTLTQEWQWSIRGGGGACHSCKRFRRASRCTVHDTEIILFSSKNNLESGEHYELNRATVSWIKGKEQHRPRSLSTLHSAHFHVAGACGLVAYPWWCSIPFYTSARFCFSHSYIPLPHSCSTSFDFPFCIRRPTPMATSTSDNDESKPCGI
jgi:hypothetical protein